MPDIDLLYKRVAPAQVTYGDDFVINLTFRPDKYVAELHNKIVADRTQNPTFDEITDALDELVIGWDLTDQGVPVPVTREALNALPIMLLRDMLIAIQTVVLSRKNAGSSTDGSSVEENKESAPATTSSLVPRDI